MKNKRSVTRILNPIKALILPVACYLIFYLLSGGLFGTATTLSNNAVKSVQTILMAWSLIFILVEGNWDMSAGAQIYFTSIVAGNLERLYSIGIVGVIVTCILVSVLLSLIKALLNYFINISFNLLSIGFMLIVECLTYFFFKGKGTFVIGDITTIARSPYCFVVLMVGFVGIMIIWKKSVLAAHIRAIGANKQRAESAGINVKKAEFKAIMVGSVFSGLSAVMFLTNAGNITPVLNMTSMPLVFDAMIAIFIGMSIQSYVSLPIAIVIGVFTIKMLGTGVLSAGIPSYMQVVITGTFLLIFLGITLNQKRFFEARDAKKRAIRIMKSIVLSENANR